MSVRFLVLGANRNKTDQRPRIGTSARKSYNRDCLERTPSGLRCWLGKQVSGWHKPAEAGEPLILFTVGLVKPPSMRLGSHAVNTAQSAHAPSVRVPSL